MLKMSLRLKEEPVEIEQPDGTVKMYVLREMSGPARDAYLTEMGKRFRMNPDGNGQMRDMDGHQSELISRSLFDDRGVLVSKGVIDTWGASVQQALFNMAQRMSAVGSTKEVQEEIKDKAKND